MRNETMSQATYRYRLWKEGKRIDTGGAVFHEMHAVIVAREMCLGNPGTTATIEKRAAGKSRYDVLYEVN